MSRELICIEQLDDDFPLALQTLYNGRSAGRFNWLTRTRPDGQASRRLWIDVEKFNEWAWLQGMKFRLRAPEKERSWER